MEISLLFPTIRRVNFNAESSVKKTHSSQNASARFVLVHAERKKDTVKVPIFFLLSTPLTHDFSREKKKKKKERAVDNTLATYQLG